MRVAVPRAFRPSRRASLFLFPVAPFLVHPLAVSRKIRFARAVTNVRIVRVQRTRRECSASVARIVFVAFVTWIIAGPTRRRGILDRTVSPYSIPVTKSDEERRHFERAPPPSVFRDGAVPLIPSRLLRRFKLSARGDGNGYVLCARPSPCIRTYSFFSLKISGRVFIFHSRAASSPGRNFVTATRRYPRASVLLPNLPTPPPSPSAARCSRDVEYLFRATLEKNCSIARRSERERACDRRRRSEEDRWEERRSVDSRGRIPRVSDS